MAKCKGCENIKNGRFPFGGLLGQPAIDTEGCGAADKDSWLFIHYCPVCGKKLKKEEKDGKAS